MPDENKTRRATVATVATLGIEIVGLYETGSAIPDFDETGATPLENARIKAYAYYAVLNRPVFACDSGLYIEGLLLSALVICNERYTMKNEIVLYRPNELAEHIEVRFDDDTGWLNRQQMAVLFAGM